MQAGDQGDLKADSCPKNELERQQKEVQTDTIFRCQVSGTRTGLSTNHVMEDSADSVAVVPMKRERRERREEACNHSRMEEFNGHGTSKNSLVLSESQADSKGSSCISKAMTTSCDGPSELEKLQQRYLNYSDS